MSETKAPYEAEADAIYWQGCWAAVSQRAAQNAGERDAAIDRADSYKGVLIALRSWIARNYRNAEAVDHPVIPSGIGAAGMVRLIDKALGESVK